MQYSSTYTGIPFFDIHTSEEALRREAKKRIMGTGK